MTIIYTTRGERERVRVRGTRIYISNNAAVAPAAAESSDDRTTSPQPVPFIKKIYA